MPISKEQFEKDGVETFSVYQFLKRNRSKAFTAMEIADAIHLVRGDNFPDDLMGVVHLMRVIDMNLSDGSVEARICRGQVYYGLRKK